MSSAIILPIFYDRNEMRRTNRRELFAKRFTSGCVVIATLFIVVGLSSATWYMTILGTFILMIVGLSGFCLKYCDRTTADSRAVRRAISISSRISSNARPSTARRAVTVGGQVGGAVADDLPPAYDNIVFDEPYQYALDTASYHFRTYDHHVSPPPPYEAIVSDANQMPTYPAPTYSSVSPVSRSVPTALVVPRFALNQYDRQSVCLSHAIGLTITSSSQVPNSETVPPVASLTDAQEASQPVTRQTLREASQVITRQSSREIASEAHQTVADDTSRAATTRLQASRTTSTPQRAEPEAPQTVAQESPQTAEHQTAATGEQSSVSTIPNDPNYRSVQSVGLDIAMNVDILNSESCALSGASDDSELTRDSEPSESSTSI